MKIIGIETVWRRRLGVVSITFLCPSTAHLVRVLAQFHLPLVDHRWGPQPRWAEDADLMVYWPDVRPCWEER